MVHLEIEFLIDLYINKIDKKNSQIFNLNPQILHQQEYVYILGS